MYKNLKAPAVECLENGNYHMHRNNQEINRIKSKKFSELSNYVHKQPII